MNAKTGLRKNSIGLFSLIFFVVAAASPLTGVVGGLPVAIFAGNGAGIPVVYLLACLILMTFSVGFIAMSRHVTNAGAFYAYISLGLGRHSGAAASILALLGYISIQIAIVSMLGFFTEALLSQHFRAAPPWWVLSGAFVAIVWVMSIKKVEIGGKILGVLMLAEVAIMLLTDTAIVTQKAGSLTFAPFTPAVFMDGHLGIAFIFAIAAYIGFESTAIYGEECREPQKTVPRATLCSLLIITAFFSFTSWALVQAWDINQISAIARRDPGNFVFDITRQYVGQWAVDTMSILLITSLFAATLAFHNNIARYFFSIARDGLIWHTLSATHPHHGTPHHACHVYSLVLMALLGAMGLAGLDPMAQIFAFGSAIATLSVLVLQTGVSAAVLAFFHRRPQLNHNRWQIRYAPLLSLCFMAGTIVLVVENLQLLSGSDSRLIMGIPWLILLCVALGYLLAWRRPVVAL
ncbi:APC family permease [Shimwellia pseudoproteus]|uniref:APC family permease n=1 Tax=Shimwellia pseudoproteus TaxID=570012 RepID=UPI0018EB6D75|nr:APC family permease [Shimwellia pseudoproteus]MBJ3813866.1 APC family permease [Shimwellia pseudoproteus]